MEFEEITTANTGIIQEIGSECSFINTAGKWNYEYSSIPHEIEAYEDALSEIYMERMRFLLSADEMIEEMLRN